MNRRLEITIGIIIVILFLMAMWWTFLKGPSGTHGPLVLGGKPLAGSLYITLQDPKTGNLGVYTYDLSAQKLTPYLANARYNITPAFSPDGKQVAVMSRWPDEQAYQLFVGSSSNFLQRQEGADANKFKQRPVWSHDATKVAYEVEGSGSVQNGLPNRWLVFVADLAKHTQQMVSSGEEPFFSPDDKTLYVLQDDGIHAVDLGILLDQKKTLPTIDPVTGHPTTGQSQQRAFPLSIPTISGTSTLASQTMKLMVSPDNSHLVWTAPLLGLTRVFKITNWAPLTMVAEKDLHKNATYAIFSPDSQYLAVEEVDLQDASTKPTNARIVAYHVGDYVSATVTDLSAYSAPYIRLTAWK